MIECAFGRLKARFSCLMRAMDINIDNLLMVIGQAKRAPHWGVQSRFRVIYMCRSVGMSVVYQNAQAELRARMLKVFGR